MPYYYLIRYQIITLFKNLYKFDDIENIFQMVLKVIFNHSSLNIKDPSNFDRSFRIVSICI